jgi:hypothetical protein
MWIWWNVRQQALQAPHGTSAGTSSWSVVSVVFSQAPNAGAGSAVVNA